MSFLWILLILVIAVHGYRQYWTNKTLQPIYTGELDAKIYQAGDTYIAVRNGGNTERTIICVPGYVENMRYFQSLYEQTDCQLILLNNADYHCPFDTDHIEQLDWPENTHPLGTIAHDAFRLCQVIAELASGKHITVHGHSRGGAITLEAGGQQPELTAELHAILEAPVLPGAHVANNGDAPLKSAIAAYLTPLILAQGRHITDEKLNKIPFMQPVTPLKTEICKSVFSNARHYRTNVINMRELQQWQRSASDELYRNYKTVTVAIGERDDVLDNPSMQASAERGQTFNPALKIVHTNGTNHFPSLESPGQMLELLPDPGR